MTRRPIHIPLLAAVLCAVGALWFAPPELGAQAPSRQRTMYVSAVDDKGEPVEGLGPSDFVIREDGQRREVLRVSRAIDPMDIALLVDTSAAAASAVSAIREGVRGFVAKMTPDNQITIIGLADR